MFAENWLQCLDVLVASPDIHACCWVADKVFVPTQSFPGSQLSLVPTMDPFGQLASGGDTSYWVIVILLPANTSCSLHKLSDLHVV